LYRYYHEVATIVSLFRIAIRTKEKHFDVNRKRKKNIVTLAMIVGDKNNALDAPQMGILGFAVLGGTS
jgi:hypothetical protein